MVSLFPCNLIRRFIVALTTFTCYAWLVCYTQWFHAWIFDLGHKSISSSCLRIGTIVIGTTPFTLPRLFLSCNSDSYDGTSVYQVIGTAKKLTLPGT